MNLPNKFDVVLEMRHVKAYEEWWLSDQGRTSTAYANCAISLAIKEKFNLIDGVFVSSASISVNGKAYAMDKPEVVRKVDMTVLNKRRTLEFSLPVNLHFEQRKVA